MSPPRTLTTIRAEGGAAALRALRDEILRRFPPGVGVLGDAAAELGTDAGNLRRALARAGAPLPAYPRGTSAPVAVQRRRERRGR